MDNNYFIIDFDSTFIKTEGLDELAAICLRRDPEINVKLGKIKEITTLGMEGKLSFEKSLKERIELLTITKYNLAELVKSLKGKISSSIKRNRAFFKKYRNRIYIISGGFKEYVVPVVGKYFISESRVFANSFVFDNNGRVTGFDRKNPLSKKGGKVKILKSLGLKGKINVLGDGYTDYELKKFGGAHNFTAFIENVKRQSVTNVADRVALNFDEFLYENGLTTAISYPKNRIRALLVENIHEDAVRKLEKEGYTVEYHETSLNHYELIKKIKDISIIGIRSGTKLPKEIIHNAKRLLAVGAFCIGTDQMDLTEASNKGIAVFNAPYSNTRSVVELILGEIIMLYRGIFPKNQNMHGGIWSKSSKDSNEVRGKTLGIIGYGNIGSQLSVLAENLGMNVVFFDILDKQTLGNARKSSSLKELLRVSDIVTVHVDGQPSNRSLIGEKEFEIMKPGAVFLNASRGFVVDMEALRMNILSGKLRGAAIDVFPQEPKKNGRGFESILRGLPNVILTPHIGGSTMEAQENIGAFVADKIVDYINTGNTSLSVNLPNIADPPTSNSHRLLHLHKNVPGILAKINTILSENQINILGQFLKTNDRIGYVITDVNKKYDKKILNSLKQIPDTIRFRVLY